MHMTWMRYTCGRLESRYSYSNTIVYNNFPWPEAPTDKQVKAIETASQKVLDARLQYPGSSLADLYDPLTMPSVLVKAHQELDKAVDLCYRPQAFISEAKRIEYLFELYERYTTGLFAKEKVKKSKQSSLSGI
ncbi:DNA methylase [Pontibacter arcticus]|uniref:DNA methylase n=2 Tax=Pontibacter arcticus TaxID=2080288 RepID=A0A364RHH2_9BACT|nr:DNA methylase [Pontibacter arcticus]